MRTRTLRANAGLVLKGGGAGSTIASAQQQRTCAGPHIGTWKLQSFTLEYHDTGQKVEVYGAHPQGYLSYGADCRMSAIVVRENRKPPAEIVPTDAEKIRLFDGLTAYAGTYSIEGDKVSHHVDISWNESWTGTTLVRYFKIEGNVLRIRTEPAKDPLDGRLTSGILVFTRVQ